MTEKMIYEKVAAFVDENLRGIPFNDGLPKFQKYVWSLGNEVGKSGADIVKIYFDFKSKEK